ncbi:MAG: nucleoside-diphosphate kinase [Deltaproteobacteria bacterium]|nr:nucleoside-diphosphate kinase [Deltaproteobacteria bacterium]
MALEKTLAIIKPDAMAKGVVGAIIQRMEENSLQPIGVKLLRLTREQAEGFYAVHKDKTFFTELVNFMTSGPVVVTCLLGEAAINKWRGVMGATNPDQAVAGSIRRDFGTDIQCNAVHGSDSPETARFEVGFFFEPQDLHEYEWL